MKLFFEKVVVFFMLFILVSVNLTAQDDEDTEQKPKIDTLKKGFHLGAYLGAYFANKYSASLYDGYGYDINGQRNNFANSLLRNEIINVYGGGNGGVDKIAELLNVAHTDWEFNESGMPINLRYQPAYLIGLNMRYVVDNKQSFLFNINGTELTVNGKFNIYSKSSGTSTNPSFNGQVNQNQFTIVGSEQRLMFQFGYQRYYGKNEKINLFSDIGMTILMAKVQKNQAYLVNNNGSIVIDLMNPYNNPSFNYYRAKYFVGVGLGAFASLGINMNINPKYTVQLLYNPSFDLVPLGDTRKFKFQQGLGLRFYYNLSI